MQGRRVRLDDLEKLARLHAGKLTDGVIGRLMGLDRKTVSHYRQVLGLGPNHNWAAGRRRELKNRSEELDRIFARLPLREKTAVLLQAGVQA